MIEDRLLRDAHKRGIDPAVLKKTARNLNLLGRCAKSIYSRPRTDIKLDPESKQAFKMKQMNAEQTRERKKQIDKLRKEDLIHRIAEKDRKTKRCLTQLSRQHPREIYKESTFSKECNQRRISKPYYFIPEPLRTALIDEFKKTYNEEKEKFEGSQKSTQQQVSQLVGSTQQFPAGDQLKHVGDKLSTIMTTLSSHPHT